MKLIVAAATIQIRTYQLNSLLHGFAGPIFSIPKKIHAHPQMMTPYREAVTFAAWSSRMTEPCLTASTGYLYFILSVLTLKVDPLNLLFTQLFLQAVSNNL